MELLGDEALVRAVLEDHTTAPLPDDLRALFVFLEKVNGASNEIGPADVETVKRAGWSDEALYDAITVCALFNFYNVWIDATGVHDMPPTGYAMTGKRLAESGYVMAKKDGGPTK